MFRIGKLSVQRVLLVFALLLGWCGAAHADCLASCMIDHDCWTDNAREHMTSYGKMCVEARKTCDTRCAGSAYGAIAYGEKSGSWGMSGVVPTALQARKDALDFCGQHGKDCKIALQVKNECAAVASGGKDIVVWAKADTLALARKAAQTDCIDKAGDACDLRHAQCFFP
ncbi:MAG: DUF4189 domain-containing protein [Alphaproteobacteria bacterium]|nr:DUF4189 domain-containing protein [Alphaproteobacteria bacterium]